MSIVEQFFAEVPEIHYNDDINLLKDYWNKCIDVEGDYIELKNSFNFCFRCSSINL